MSRVQGEIDSAVARGREQERMQIETDVKLSRGQTPTIDSNIYDPQQLKDEGYSLSNPSNMPNRNTKEGARYFAGRDSADGTLLRPITLKPDLLSRLPQTSMYMDRSDQIFSELESAKTDVDIEMGLTNIYKQYIDYTNSLANDDPAIANDQANRLKWNTIDRLESTGFEHLQRSEYVDEGLDDVGMNGLMMVFAAGLFQGKAYEQILKDVGETGANPTQLEETYDRAVQGNERAQYNVINKLPNTNEEAMNDPRYIGAATLLAGLSGRSDEKIANMSTKDLLAVGKTEADFLKSNLGSLAQAQAWIKDNPDKPVAEALDFMLKTDENLPYEWQDTARQVAGMAGDPTTYLGGYGIWSKFASKKGSGIILGKLGIGSTFGAGMGAGYGALYDIGMQNVDIAARNQKEFDPARLGQTVAIGAGAGYVLGAVPPVIKAIKDAVPMVKKTLKAVDEFAEHDFNEFGKDQ